MIFNGFFIKYIVQWLKTSNFKSLKKKILHLQSDWKTNFYFQCHLCRSSLQVIHGSVGNVFVLLIIMSTSWTPMLARVRSWAAPVNVCNALSLRIDSGLWNFPTVKLGKLRYHLYWVESTINQQLKKNILSSSQSPRFNIVCIIQVSEKDVLL